MSIIKIWHNPRCAKSREALKALEKGGHTLEVIKYLEVVPSFEEMTKTLKMLNMTARELMRVNEDIYKELQLKTQTDETKLIQAMVDNPKLIQRPIVYQNDKALLARPASLIENWLK